MKVSVILKENKSDKYSIANEHCFYLDSIITNPKDSKLKKSIVRHNIFNFLSSKENFKLCPNSLAIDFANISMAAYAIDQAANREKFGHYGWSRYIELNIPVYNLEKWNSSKQQFERTLSFLSGDKWILNFRKCKKPFPSFTISEFRTDKVCLFSGGMDSFIGISDIMSNKNSLATISHHKGGNSGELTTQKELVNLLQNEVADKEILPYYFFVQARKNDVLLGERTQRARSILFLSLALLVANSSSDNTEVIIPENGLISLNLPLTPARGGSHSTKTTHPKYISSLNEIFEIVGINNRIINPYRFMTKGEMFAKTKMPKFVSENINKTLSCSKPGYYQQWKGEKERQCGHCVPCIIRRSSMYLINKDDAKNYVKNVIGSNHKYDDFNAFKIAIKRYSKKDKIRLAFQKSGYMDISEFEIRKYVNMYKRGLKEVRNFMNQS
ncbi:Qat anti-phage system QueC-like protein QatC [uncultured Maribacter sp.]|uniref:Qat anti-phage system QueC-like protein QatC n=1 Tax=uncultured Maribacter sp. TaxID=431308 RepID=UPI0030ECB257|tara:strand:- start:13086 stop:14408 length:1323 start_codon:yes stop_codon:yes gene_type:complete